MNNNKKVYSYCNDCDWYATPNKHQFNNVPTAAEYHTKQNNNHCATVGSSEKIKKEATKRERNQK